MQSGNFICRAPSNIAFLKYWGKRDAASQWASGPSLSMTLSNAITETGVSLLPGHAGDEIYYEGALLGLDDQRAQRVVRHLDRLRAEVGRNDALRVQTRNTFPASCGIASSASGFAALTIAGVAALTGVQEMHELVSRGFSRERLAHLARLGSGSAGRSLWGGFVVWDPDFSPENQKIFPLDVASEWDLADFILVPESAPKKVGSTAAHRAAESSPLYSVRISGLEERLKQFEQAIRGRDFSLLGPLLESEALEMHAVAMTSMPPIQYMGSKTLSLLAEIRSWRQQAHVPAYFTLDAGATVHLIFDRQYESKVRQFLMQHAPGLKVLEDRVGHGPELFFRPGPFQNKG